MSEQKIYTKTKIAYKKQNLEQNCVLQESRQGRSLRRRLVRLSHVLLCCTYQNFGSNLFLFSSVWKIQMLRDFARFTGVV